MKKRATILIFLLCTAMGLQAQSLSKNEIAKYETEVTSLINYLEETLNFLGDSATSAREKEIVYSESWSKMFIDEKVQVEDDLDIHRTTPINKDVQAYLKDIDFFFKKAHFKFDVQSIANNTRENGNVYFKVTLSRQLYALTINDEVVDNNNTRYVEINLDRQNSSLKIASIYTSKINEKKSLRKWWNSLSKSWKTQLGKGIMLYDSIPLASVSSIVDTHFTASYPKIDRVKGDTTYQDKIFKNDINELDHKLKLAVQQQHVDISGIREIISLEPIDELSDLTWLDISGTSIDDLSPVRNTNKLKVLRANSTLIEDISSLRYNNTLEELEVANTSISDLSVLSALRNLQKLDISNTMVNRIAQLKNCPNLNTLHVGGCNITNIGILQELTLLKSVNISNTAVRDLSPISKLENLRSLNLSGTPIANLQALAGMESLRELYCSNTSIRDLSPLKSNRRLNRIYCDHTNIGDVEASAFTKDNPFTLVIYDTEALKNWWNSLPIYWKVVFSKQIQLGSEPTTEQLHQIINLQELDISGNNHLQSLMPVSRLTNLKSLNISNTEIPNLFAIQGLTNLESLNIAHTYISDLTPLQELNSLRFLNIMNTPVTDISALNNDGSIEVIQADSTTIGHSQVVELKKNQRQVTVIYQTEALLAWWDNLDDTWKNLFRDVISTPSETPSALELQRIVDLRELVIDPETPIVSIAPLTDFMWLERLTINNQSVSDLTPLFNKEFLVELNAQNNPINDLTAIERSVSLELLNIENTQIKELDPLSKMNNLITLNASGTLVKSLKPLSGLQKLENLFINNTDVRSLSPVENIASLKQLKVYNTKVKKNAVEKLQQKRLDMNIIYY